MIAKLDNGPSDPGLPIPQIENITDPVDGSVNK